MTAAAHSVRRAVVRVERRLTGERLAAPGLLLAAATLIVAGLATAHLQLDGHGLAFSLPVSYYIGLVLLPVASAAEWRRADARPLVALLPVAAYVVAVWLAPVVLEGTPRFRTSYLSFGYVDPVLRGDGLRPYTFVYHNWPLFPYLFAGLQKALGPAPEGVMAAFPTFIVLLYLIPLMAILQRLETAGEAAGLLAAESRPPRSWLPAAGMRWLLGMWIFVVFNWSGQDYFSPQAVAYLVFLCWLAVLAEVALRRDGNFDVPRTALVLMLFAILVAVHVLTAFVSLFLLSGLTLARLLRRPGVLGACVLLFVAWQAYLAAPFFSQYGGRFVSTVLAAGDFLQANVSGRLAGSPEHLTIVRARVVSTALAFALAALALVRLLRARAVRRAPVRFALAAGAGLAVVTPVSVYGGEMLIRSLLFGLPFIGVLVVLASGRRLVAGVALALVVAMAPVHLITHFGNELYDYVSPGELRGYRFVAERLAPAKVYGGFPAGAYLNTVRLEWRNSIVPRADQPPKVGNFLDPERHHWQRNAWPIYVVVSRGDKAAATLFFNRPSFVPRATQLLNQDRRFRRVFFDPDFSVYRWLG